MCMYESMYAYSVYVCLYAHVVCMFVRIVCVYVCRYMCMYIANAWKAFLKGHLLI